jgi:hypothetical protein
MAEPVGHRLLNGQVNYPLASITERGGHIADREQESIALIPLDLAAPKLIGSRPLSL